jgi:hypothetical protein
MSVDGRMVFDGPLTNAFAHLVDAAFFLLGPTPETFAVPSEVRARLLRARPIESYDFRRIEGLTTEGIPFEIAAAHCATETLPWTITVEMQDGRRLVLDESQMPSSKDLLLTCHRAAFAIMRGETCPRSRLRDCIGYTSVTSATLHSSGGIHNIPSEIRLLGEHDDRIHHSPDILNFLRTAIVEGRFPRNAPSWLAPGDIVPVPRSLPEPRRNLNDFPPENWAMPQNVTTARIAFDTETSSTSVSSTIGGFSSTP